MRTQQARPVGGATVVLTDSGGDVLDASLTGGDGWYRFGDVSGGAYTLAVTAQGYRPQATPVRMTTGQQLAQDVELAATGRLAGIVRSELSGQAVAEARVVLLDADGTVAGVTLTGTDGTYRFDDVDHGRYTVIASGYGPATATVDVPDGDGSLDFDLGYSAGGVAGDGTFDNSARGNNPVGHDGLRTGRADEE
ncbi:hypothetical protein BJF85_10570 [Saccharomonospora sp. CUA-673]|uniref:MSCRAMM family protein n=1 Tax=Saccharomonospora sp. CUA-673 TaxID=1904969 RepID=UPI0009631917|nr:hypothetical protein BJF85_10570 [Saccharomonospora sp. CUA-673]